MKFHNEKLGGYVKLNDPLEFSIGYKFYYCGKMFCRLMIVGFVKDLTRLLKLRNKNIVCIAPDDYKIIKNNIVLSPVTCSADELDEDVSMFKKRFGCDINDWIAPLLMRAITNIKVIPDYTKNENKDIQFFDLIVPKYESVSEEKYPSYVDNGFYLALNILGLEKKLYATDYKNARVDLTDLDVKLINDAIKFNPDTSGQGKLDL